MMRLPHFKYQAPRTVREAAEMLAAPGGAMTAAMRSTVCGLTALQST